MRICSNFALNVYLPIYLLLIICFIVILHVKSLESLDLYMKGKGHNLCCEYL